MRTFARNAHRGNPVIKLEAGSMLLVPPRHGKSELASRRFPAWFLGRHPDKQFISASASATLAEDFGRDVRNLIASQEYAQLFETRLSEDAQARGRWTTQEGGSYFATGVGGALMGRGAHVLLIDEQSPVSIGVNSSFPLNLRHPAARQFRICNFIGRVVLFHIRPFPTPPSPPWPEY
jgi:hypothetical protein